MLGEQLLCELGHGPGCGRLLGRPSLRSRAADAVVLHGEAVQPSERRRLLGDGLAQFVGGRANGLVEQGQQEAVLAVEVLVEAAQ